MKLIKFLSGVRCCTQIMPENSANGDNYKPMLFRNNKGRLILCGNGIDLFDLLGWVNRNPLAQFREITKEETHTISMEESLAIGGPTMIQEMRMPEPFEPIYCLRHLFDEKGNVL